MKLRLLLKSVLVALALTSLSWAGSFDKPLIKKTVVLGPSPSSATRKIRAKVTCYFFADFMVKEVDLGEKGADRLAIVPSTKRAPAPCTRSLGKTERVINADDWTGYFKGVKGSLVFFDADDGVNGGMGFAIFDGKTGRKIFSDSADGPVQFPDAPDNSLSIRYARVVDGGCILPKEPAACWEKIRKALVLDNAAAPDCHAAYEKSAQALAKGRCQAQSNAGQQCLTKELPLARQQTADATSIIAYQVDVVFSLPPDAPPAIKPITGDLRCWPSD